MHPTTTELSFEERVLRQARDRGTLDCHSRFDHVHLLERQIQRTRGAVERCKSDPSSQNQLFATKQIAQSLFELIVHCHLQGVLMGDCVGERNLFAKTPPVWPLVHTYISGLKVANETLPPGDILTKRAIAQIHTCLGNASMVCLGMTPEHCLELTMGADHGQ